jgi:hypothetical protein
MNILAKNTCWDVAELCHRWFFSLHVIPKIFPTVQISMAQIANGISSNDFVGLVGVDMIDGLCFGQNFGNNRVVKIELCVRGHHNCWLDLTDADTDDPSEARTSWRSHDHLLSKGFNRERYGSSSELIYKSGDGIEIELFGDGPKKSLKFGTRVFSLFVSKSLRDIYPGSIGTKPSNIKQ